MTYIIGNSQDKMMSRTYRQTAAVAKIKEALKEYLAAMKLVNKTPGTLWVTKKDYDRLIADENKYLASKHEYPEKVTAPQPFDGIQIGCYR